MKQLIFVYNANSGLFNAITDAAHKSFSPGTYHCKLCLLTYGAVTQKRQWSQFIANLKIKSTFLHKDEFQKLYPSLSPTSFPAVFIKNGSPKLLISAQQLNTKDTLYQLQNLVTDKLKNLT